MNDLITTTRTEFDLLPVNAGKDARHRIGKFTEWLHTTGGNVTAPDLAAYRDHLLEQKYFDKKKKEFVNLSPETVSAHLSTVRGAYDRILRENATRDLLYRQAEIHTETAADRKAFVDEVITRMRNATDPANSPVKMKTRQDVADSEHIRLTKEQAETLLNSPGVSPGIDTIQGLRDTAVLAVMLCTGIREMELCRLDVKDLRQELGGELALHVREGKGAKERLIPYGELNWCLVIVDRWLAAAGIESGPVFRGLYKGGQKLRPGRLSVRAVGYIVNSYPVAKNGETVNVAPHDLRRTYARRLYEAGADLVAIQQNLGHADIKTTLGYIGTLDAESRRAPSVYSYDLRQLNGAPGKQLKME